jgi:hypothetical protein
MNNPHSNPNDLSILDPQPRVLWLPSFSRPLQIYPLRVRQLQAFVAAALPVAARLVDGDADLPAVLAEHQGPIRSIVRIAATLEMHLGPDIRDEDLLSALAGIIDVNRDLLEAMASTASDQGADDGADAGWSDTLQALVSAGHRPSDILCYTLAQVRWWGDAIERARRLKVGDNVLAARLALSGSDHMGGILRSLGARA